ALADWDCRNNRLAWLGLRQDGFIDKVRIARERYGANRIALLLGTSTASIGATEEAYRRLDADGGLPDDMLRPAIHTPHSLSAFVAAALELTGPCLTVSTACSSRATASRSARRPVSPCSSAAGWLPMRRNCSATAKPATRTTCPRRIRRDSA